MYKESSKTPYLASTLISKYTDEKVLDDFKDPTKYDVSIYNQYISIVEERIQPPNKLSIPTPAPTPAVLPPPMYNLPQPTYAVPTPYMVPPPAPPILAPPPGIQYPSYAVPTVPPPAVVPPPVSVCINPRMENHATRSNVISISTSGTSGLAREFFREKESILIDDGDVAEKEKQKDQEALLKKQLEAREMMRGSRKDGSRRSSDRISPGDNPLRITNEIDKQIANLDKEILANRWAPPAPADVELDRFGYVVRNSAKASTDPAELYRSMFSQEENGSRRRKRPGSRSPSPSKRRRRSRSRGRTTRSRSRGRNTRSRSRGRRSRSRGRHTRSRSRERRHRSRSRRRRRPTKSPVRSRSKSPEEKRRSKSRSKDKDGNKKSKYSGPPVPSFMQHPADRLFSGDVGRSNSVRKRMEIRKDTGIDVVDATKIALDATLALTKDMQTDPNEVNKEPTIVTMEVEFLDDGDYKQFTQIGIGCEDKETAVYNRSLFKAILPSHMEKYEQNLILKNQKNLHSSLKFNHNENDNTYTFQHIKKGVVELVSEETALKDLVAFIKSLRKDSSVVIFTLNKATFVPLLLSRLVKYKILAEFTAIVKGFCDFSSCISSLKLNEFWKQTRSSVKEASDLTDVYKHIMGKNWPKESRHCDGISILSGNVLKKMISDHMEYLNELNFKLSFNKFLSVCGLQSPSEMIISSNKEISAIRDVPQVENVKEIELVPSERPGEITIITLKRFECIDVLDQDEVEEEDINEDDYFVSDQVVASLVNQVVIKPGFVASVTLKISTTTPYKIEKWCLVHKNINFGTAIVKSEDKQVTELLKKRIAKVKQCQVSRQIVQVSSIRDQLSTASVSLIQVKVLNPLDSDVVLNIGDEIASVRLEKEPSPDDPLCKTYSQIKAEALKSVKGNDEEFDELLAADKNLDKATPKLSKDAMKEIRREALMEKLDEENGTGSNMKFNADDENLLSQLRQVKPKKIRGKRKRKNKKQVTDDSNKPTDSTIEIIDSDDDRPAITNQTIEDVNSDEDFPAVSPVRTPSLSSVSDGDGNSSRARSISCDELSDYELPAGGKKVADRFYEIDFFVQTHNMFTSIAGMEMEKCLMSIKDDHGFTINDFDGKKCRISINPDYAGSEKKFPSGKAVNSYLVQQLETEVWLTKDPRSSAMLPLVDVEVTNSTSNGIHYPKGVALAVCRFIKPEQKKRSSNQKKVNSDAALSDPLAQMPEPVASVSTFFMPEPVASLSSPVIQEPVPSVRTEKPRKVTKRVSSDDHGDKSDPKLVMRCFPSKTFHVNPGASYTITLIVAEDKNDSRTSMENLLKKQCVVKINDNADRTYNFELENTVTWIHKYTSPNGNEYPAVRVEIRNPTKFKENYFRHQPLAICEVKLAPLRVSITNDMFGGNLPAPVPALTSGDDHENFTTIDSWSASELPEPESPPPPLPTEEEMRAWSVRKLKMCLGDVGLHQYGLKIDLVTRLLEYYKKNPSKVPKPPLSSRDVAREVLDAVMFNVFKTVAPSSKHTVVDNGLGGNVSLSSAGGVYSANGKQIPVLGAGRRSQPEPPAARVDPKVAENEKILRKVAEIKAFEKLDLDFFKAGMSIMCHDDICIGPRVKKIVTFKLPQLDMFSSELAGRRVLIKERDNDRDILTVHKQISNIIINDRKSEVDVLVENSFDKQVVVKASEKIKLIRVYVERHVKDLDHQFDIPEDDDIIDVVEDILEKEAFDATSTNDISMMPKTYHTEECVVKLNKTLDYQSFALMERTNHSSMQIGMRKMIIIPKVFYLLGPSTDSQEVRIKIRMYNASKQKLKFTKKTKIAKVRLQKSEDVFSEKDHRLEPDQRRKYGEVRDLEGREITEGQPVLYTHTYDGVARPSVVNIINRNGRLCVPLGSEQSGEYLLFQRQDSNFNLFSGQRKNFMVRFLRNHE